MRRRPKLGQHFLTDFGYRRRVVDALRLGPDDLAVEIGAGRGAMTELLAERARRLIALELDPLLVEKLRNDFQSRPGVEILRGDVLSTDLAALCRRGETEKCFVFGNLPYYITSPIIHHLFRSWTSIRAMSLLVQREVAQRLTAAPGTRTYGYLSVLTGFYSRPKIVLSVPPGAFSPRPKVYSALVEFEMHSMFAEWERGEQEKFLGFVKHCFAQKRKNLLNNLAGIYTRENVADELRRLDVPATIRAEGLTLEQLVRLYGALDRPQGSGARPFEV